MVRRIVACSVDFGAKISFDIRYDIDHWSAAGCFDVLAQRMDDRAESRRLRESERNVVE